MFDSVAVLCKAENNLRVLIDVWNVEILFDFFTNSRLVIRCNGLKLRYQLRKLVTRFGIVVVFIVCGVKM